MDRQESPLMPGSDMPCRDPAHPLPGVVTEAGYIE